MTGNNYAMRASALFLIVATAGCNSRLSQNDSSQVETNQNVSRSETETPAAERFGRLVSAEGTYTAPDGMTYAGVTGYYAQPDGSIQACAWNRQGVLVTCRLYALPQPAVSGSPE